ncbi:MAG: ATP-binding protein [Candidatus Omnitrophota bacterium]
MNLFAITSFFLSLACYSLALLIFIYSKRRLHVYWAFFNVAVGTYGLGMFLAGITKNYDQAFLSWKIAYLGVGSIGMLFYFVVSEFCKLRNQRSKFFVFIHGLLFSILAVSTDSIVVSLRLAYSQFYLPIAGFWWNFFFSIWILIVVAAFVYLYEDIKRSHGVKVVQGKYLFYGMLLGFLSGASTSLNTWGINIYPAWHFFICVYAAICTYAIFRYRLLDIRIAVTRFAIFVLVYSVVLGIPFGMAIWGRDWLINMFGQGWFWAPMIFLLIFATAGPSIYIFLQRKAEDKLLQEERRINRLLTKASYEMTSIRHLTTLLHSIIDTLTDILQTEKVQIFILNKAVNTYELKAPRGIKTVAPISGEDALVRALMSKRCPLIYDEFQSAVEAIPVGIDENAVPPIQKLRGNVIVPIANDAALLGFIVLGDLKGKETYSLELLGALNVLGNQAALAITNCYFLEEEARRMEEAGLQERRISLDHIASSMAHEIDNPMSVICGQVEVLRETLEDVRIIMPDEMRESIHTSMDYILEAQKRVSGMVSEIKDYSKKPDGEFKLIRIEDVEAGYLRLFGFMFKKPENRGVEYIKEIDEGLPYILGDKIQLEEIFFNFASNSLYAVRSSDVKKINLKIFRKDGDWIRIEYSDTGSGIDKNIINDIFLAHVTTKGSAEGSGLGLFRVRKIIELHKGRVWAESGGKSMGARMVIELPVFKGNIQERLDKEKSVERSKLVF